MSALWSSLFTGIDIFWFWSFSIEIFTNLDWAILWRFVQCMLLWAKDALNGIVTQYNYNIKIYPTYFLKLSYYLNINWVISSTNSKNLTNLHHDCFIFLRRRPLLKQCIMGSDDVIRMLLWANTTVLLTVLLP